MPQPMNPAMAMQRNRMAQAMMGGPGGQRQPPPQVRPQQPIGQPLNAGQATSPAFNSMYNTAQGAFPPRPQPGAPAAGVASPQMPQQPLAQQPLPQAPPAQPAPPLPQQMFDPSMMG